MSIELEKLLRDFVKFQSKQTYHGRIPDFQNIAAQIYKDNIINNNPISVEELEEFLEDLYDAKYPINNTSNGGKQMQIYPLVRNGVKWIRKCCKSNHNISI